MARIPSAAGTVQQGASLPARAALRIVESSTQQAAASTDAAATSQVLRDLYGRLDRIEQLLRILPILIAQSADPNHLSIEGAARVLGVSTKTIRRRITSGTLTLETIVGTRRTGIPVEQVYAGVWVPLALSRKLLDEERRELDELKRKSR